MAEGVAVSPYGTDLAGTFAARPSNAPAGVTYFATDTRVGYVSRGDDNWDKTSKASTTTTPVAAAGSTVEDAGALPDTEVSFITSDGATKGVVLPTGVAGMQRIVINNSATAAEIYAAEGGTINGAAADASMVVAASKGVWCFCTAADTWVAFDLPAKATAS